MEPMTLVTKHDAVNPVQCYWQYVNAKIATSNPLEEYWRHTLRLIFEKNTSKDPWNNIKLELSAVVEANEKNNKQYIKELFSEFIKKDHSHLMVSMSPSQTRLYRWIMDTPGFQIHHSDSKTLLIKCCLNHKLEDCTYPPFKTLSLGITVVLFNSDLTQFLAIQENTGPYRGWKAPTGGVDYEKEDELEAAMRELYEETNIEISKDQLKLVGMAPTSAFRGRNPDRNFIFTGKCESNSQHIKPQEKEIKQVAWLSLDEFLNSKLPVSHESRPLVLQEVVRIAKKSLEQNLGWQPQDAFWGSGKPASIYSCKIEKIT